MEQLLERAYAKINLGLDVVRKREDGYHEVRMVMQTIDVYDEILLTKTQEPGISLRVIGRDDLEADDHNLAYRAAKSLMDDRKNRGIEDCGVRIDLTKKIPMAAGLAGGSADCAAVLRGMNHLFDMGYSEEELKAFGVKIGADVPYCVMGGTALAEGIGEILSRLEDCPDACCLIAKPPIDVPTKFVYGNLKAAELEYHPDIDGMVAAIRNQDLDGVIKRMGNVLETVTIPAHPVIGQLKKLMMDHGAAGSMMSGSGPTVFGIFKTRDQMQEAYEAILASNLAPETYMSSLIHPGHM